MDRYQDLARVLTRLWKEETKVIPIVVGVLGSVIKSLDKKLNNTHTYNHYTALWSLSGTSRVSRYQKVHFAVFWIFWSKMKITQTDATTIWMDCHPIQTNWFPHLCHTHNFYAGWPSSHNPPNLSWLGTGTKYAGLHTRWLGCIPGGLVEQSWIKCSSWIASKSCSHGNITNTEKGTGLWLG